MAKAEVRCPVCGSSMVIGNGGNAVTELTDGIHYLVPETIRNENVKSAKAEIRMEALKAAGVDVTKLQTLIQKDDSIKGIFASDDPVIEELSKGGFIKNRELFRRFITAQTFRLLKYSDSWTDAVRKFYDTKYVFEQTKRELALQIKLTKKGVRSDARFTFFTGDDFKRIFVELMKVNEGIWDKDKKQFWIGRINSADSLEEIYDTVTSFRWRFKYDCTFKPRTWLNCFKGAGAYYTLQNIIRTHGMILPKCMDMDESLDFVDTVYKSIIGYEPRERRWDILMSVLVNAVKETCFELKF